MCSPGVPLVAIVFINFALWDIPKMHGSSQVAYRQKKIVLLALKYGQKFDRMLGSL